MTRIPRTDSSNRIGYYADFISRLVAFVLDTVFISVSYTVILWLINVTITTMQFRRILGFSLKEFPQMLEFVDRLSNPESLAAWAILYMLVYHIFFTVLTGQTLGKALMGLRIVSITGKRISIFQALIRLIAFFISVSIIFIGLLWVFVDNKRQGLHDKIAGTYVIYTWDAVPDERFLQDEIEKITNRLPDATPVVGNKPT